MRSRLAQWHGWSINVWVSPSSRLREKECPSFLSNCIHSFIHSFTMRTAFPQFKNQKVETGLQGECPRHHCSRSTSSALPRRLVSPVSCLSFQKYFTHPREYMFTSSSSFCYTNGSILDASFLLCFVCVFPPTQQYILEKIEQWYIHGFSVISLSGYFSIAWIFHGVFNRSPVDGHSYCSQSLPVLNNSVINNFGHNIMLICIYISKIPSQK